MAIFNPFDTVEDAFFRKWFANANFDPSGGIISGGLALAGGLFSAAGTLAGGSNAAQLGQMQQAQQEFQAAQLRENSAADIAGAQRQALDITNKANLLRSSSVANAAAGGVVTTSGSAVTNEGEIMQRGRYASALAMFNGENAATSDLNKASSAEYTGAIEAAGGNMQQQASYLSAAGTLMGAGGNAYKMYMTQNATGSGAGVPN